MDGLVKGLEWVGSRTEHYEEMVEFYWDTRSSTRRENSRSSGCRTAARPRSSVPLTPSTPTSLEDRSPVFWWKTLRVPAGFWRLRASSSSVPYTSGNPQGRRGRTFAPLTATSTR
jgi:hypothetical protein